MLAGVALGCKDEGYGCWIRLQFQSGAEPTCFPIASTGRAVSVTMDSSSGNRAGMKREPAELDRKAEELARLSLTG